jgi:hypothetical protein
LTEATSAPPVALDWKLLGQKADPGSSDVVHREGNIDRATAPRLRVHGTGRRASAHSCPPSARACGRKAAVQRTAKLGAGHAKSKFLWPATLILGNALRFDCSTLCRPLRPSLPGRVPPQSSTSSGSVVRRIADARSASLECSQWVEGAAGPAGPTNSRLSAHSGRWRKKVGAASTTAFRVLPM